MFTGMSASFIPTSTGTMNITSTSMMRHGMERSLTPMSIRTNRWSMRTRTIPICTIGTVIDLIELVQTCSPLHPPLVTVQQAIFTRGHFSDSTTAR
jgi:hypothetical protein